MSDSDLMSVVWMGSGGRRPGLWVVSSEADQPCRLLDLPHGQSVYAVDADVEEGMIVAGTRGGTIEVFSWDACGPGISSPPRQSLYQAAPVLEVCLAARGRLVAADAAGRCLCWRLDASEASPVPLDTKGHQVCAMLRLDEGLLLGLSGRGTLLRWEVGQGALIERIKGPAPPARLSLVRLVHWPAANVVVYPVRGGKLAMWDIDGGKVSTRRAHDRDFYAMIPQRDRLLTVGKDDSRCVAWSDREGQAAAAYDAPSGVVSGVSVPWRDSELILVRENGQAGRYAIEDGAIRQVCSYPSLELRVASGPSESDVRRRAERSRLEQARRLQEEIRSRIESGRTDGIDAKYRQLSELGFGGVCLGLKAQQAQHEGDMPKELAIRRELAARLDPAEPLATRSLLRFADLLVASWQLARAMDVYSQLAETDPTAAPPAWVPEAQAVMEGANWVVRPAFAIRQLLDAADAVCSALVGRWVVPASSALIVFPRTGLDAEDLADRCRRVQAEGPVESVARIAALPLAWLSQGDIRPYPTVMLDPAADSPEAHVAFAIRIEPRPSESLLEPVAMLDAGRSVSAGSWREHNQQVRGLLGQVDGLEDSALWPQALRGIVTTALRRMKTEAMWVSRQREQRT